MNQVRLAVIGTGHLGKIHARLAREVEGAELVGVVEPSEHARTAVCSELGVAGYAHHDEIIDRIDAAIVAAPTRFHHALTMELLSAGKHVLVEKPITVTVEEADELIAAASADQLVLAVGHVERFNPALTAAIPHIRSPRYIEGRRTSGFTFRSTDVGVVLDVMIHDIDAVLSLVDSALVDVQAMGITLFGPHEDMVQARLTFANGCIANLSGSRTSPEVARTMQVFSEAGFASIDFGARETVVIEPGALLGRRGIDINETPPQRQQHIRERLFDDPALLPLQRITPPAANPLRDEQQDFCDAIRSGGAPRVTGQQGRDALWAAQRIIRSVERHQWDGSAQGRVGPYALPLGAKPQRKAA